MHAWSMRSGMHEDCEHDLNRMLLTIYTTSGNLLTERVGLKPVYLLGCGGHVYTQARVLLIEPRSSMWQIATSPTTTTWTAGCSVRATTYHTVVLQ